MADKIPPLPPQAPATPLPLGAPLPPFAASGGAGMPPPAMGGPPPLDQGGAGAPPPPMPPDGERIERDPPEPEPGRAALVTELAAAVKAAKGKWERDYKRMREDMAFALGVQWPNQTKDDGRYVANIVQRHIQQRTAVLYAKNPTAVAKRKDRIDYTVWDGTLQQYSQAQQAVQGAAMMMMPPPPAALMILQDHDTVMARRQMLDRVAQTLEIVYAYYIGEQVHTFKAEMKRAVRRTITCGVSYVRLGFQRIMQKSPDIERQLADFQMQLASLQVKAADLADGEEDPDSATAERLKLQINALAGQADVLLREGLTFDFPLATSIIPDCKCRSLMTFAGSDWVAEEFLLSPQEVQAVYQVDVCSRYNAWNETPTAELPGNDATTDLLRSQLDAKGNRRDVLLWTIYHIADGLMYTVADGYPDFLEEPAAPTPLLERFWPWFPLIFNELESEHSIFPISDVRLIRSQQEEYNRSREGLREHRRANRPMTAVAAGVLDDEDRGKLTNRPANAIIELNALQPGQKVADVLQPVQGPPLDPNLYETNGTFQDILRVVGTQEANLGGTSNATATESSIAEGSRMSSLESNVDDLDDLLTALARAGGQVLLSELAPQTAKEIAGAGAAWPQLDRRAIASELDLTVEAGSSGRPNKAQEVANLERLMPFLLQIPGLSPEWLAKEVVRRMDDRIDLDEAVAPGAMSATAMNAMAGKAAGGPAGGPAGNGGPPEPGRDGGQPGGANNAPQPAESQAQQPRPGRPPMQPVSPSQVLGNAS